MQLASVWLGSKSCNSKSRAMPNPLLGGHSRMCNSQLVPIRSCNAAAARNVCKAAEQPAHLGLAPLP